MLNFADFLVSGFILSLFVSIYRKKSSAAVRFWVVGWSCIVFHSGLLLWHPDAELIRIALEIASVSMLFLCGTAFALSYPQSQTSVRRQFWVAGLLGVPWLLTGLFGCLSPAWFGFAAFFAAVSHVCVLGVLLVLVGPRLRFTAGVLMVGACAAWFGMALQQHDSHAVITITLTLSFGLSALLLGGRSPRFSAATVTTSIGATTWALVGLGSLLVQRFLVGRVVSPGIWNLPKYLVAAGMVLTVLEEEIRAKETTNRQYRLLFEANPHPMWIYDPETLQFLEVNDSAVSHYGYSRPEFQELTLLDVVETGLHPETLADLQTTAPQTLSGPWLHRRKDGSEFQVDIASHPVEREGGRATVTLIHDVTESQRLHAQLIRLAHHDVLTGLPNRAFFEATLEDTLAVAAKNGRRAAVFCIDLDRFKQINDTFGHNAGDRCLCEIANRITARLQGIGTLARTGGDEFMLVLGDLERAELADHLASLLLYDLKPCLQLDVGEVELVASIGIAVYPEDGVQGAQLWRDADAAMYRAKRAGGSQWVRVSREISRITAEANDIEVCLRRALKTGGLALAYQPQMTTSGELHCLEALVRFVDPMLATARAEQVIGIAEESGLIVLLGEWVLDEVCRQSRAWIDEGLPPVQIAVNVSPLQLNRGNFSLKVASTLERYQLAPRMLEFEVTESTVMPDRGTAPEQIALLARMGIRFSVDDFGTGYSSLGRLHQLPVEALKIDASFIRLIAERKGTYPTVRAIIALAHTFGLQVVAEGVETEEQLKTLRALRCDRVQGYLFSRPLPSNETTSFLARCSKGLPLNPEQASAAAAADVQAESA